MKAILTIAALFCATIVARASVDPADVIIQSDPTSQTLVIRTTTAVSELTRVRITDARGVEMYLCEVAPHGFVSKRFRQYLFPRG